MSKYQTLPKYLNIKDPYEQSERLLKLNSGYRYIIVANMECMISPCLHPSEAESIAKRRLDIFLRDNYQAIRALRSYHQIIDSRANIGTGQMEALKVSIARLSHRKLRWNDGALCIIFDKWDHFKHTGGRFSAPLGEEVEAVKGFWFPFRLVGNLFDCVGLDDGKSRQYFDEKSIEEKRIFVESFAERRRNAVVYDGDAEKLPFRFAAFLTDISGSFIVDELVAYRDEISQGDQTMKDVFEKLRVQFARRVI